MSAAHDRDAEHLSRGVSDYIDRRFRREFSTEEELEEQVFASLRGLPELPEMPTILTAVIYARFP